MLNLFDLEEKKPEWEKEWKDMPEFVQDQKKAYAQIIFRFSNEEDLQSFATLIGQKLTNKTKSAWFPFKSHWGEIKKIWTDEK
jgi:hypothetical protein